MWKSFKNVGWKPASRKKRKKERAKYNSIAKARPRNHQNGGILGKIQILWLVVKTHWKLRAKDVLLNKLHAGRQNHPRNWWNGPICCCMMLFAEVRSILSLPSDDRQAQHVLSLVTLTFNLDIQTRPSKGPNTSSVWIWRQYIQQFPTHLIHKQTKKQSHRQR